VEIFTTKNGVRLEVGRIARERLDAFSATHLPPVPPTRQMEVFGGEVEDVPILDDSAYQARLMDYYVSLGHDQIAAIVGAVQILDWDEAQARAELAELQAIGLGDGGEADLLRYVILADIDDLAAVVNLVAYQSTVTDRGVQEAADAFAVTWTGKPVLALKVPSTPGRYSMVFEARTAAKYAGYTWEQFCALPGPEQSAVVAFHLLEQKLEWLAAKG